MKNIVPSSCLRFAARALRGQRVQLGAALLLAPLAARADPGDLYESDDNNHVYNFTPSGNQNTFAAGLNGPLGLGFDSKGNLYKADDYSNSVLKFSPTGAESTFASDVDPEFLAFQPDVVPEPST